MSKRGPLDAFVARLAPPSSKKAKAAADDGAKQLGKAVVHRSSDDVTQHTVAAGHDQDAAAAGQLQPSAVTAAAGAGAAVQTLTAEEPALVAAVASVATAGAAATAAAAASGTAFGALMAAAKAGSGPGAAGRKAGGSGSGGSDSTSKLSQEDMQQRAARNQAAAAGAVQQAVAAKQHPQLRSLLCEPSWLDVLGPEFDKPYMHQLQSFLQQEWGSHTIYPPQDSIFRAFNAVPFDQVRIVILGQDPYINQGEAMGLSFSVPPGIRVPPSLVNIYKELAQDVGTTVPRHGCLQKWCSQGVLLLNAALTVRAKSSNSHAGKGWEAFTSAALSALVKQRSGIVFMLWGKYAQDRCAKLDMRKHHVLKSVHPSPLSAHRGFLGCGHFSKANQLLVKAGQPPIDWQIE